MTGIFRILVQSIDCPPFFFVSSVNINRRSLNTRVTKDVLDRESIRSGFSKSRSRYVAKVVEEKILDSRILF